MTLSPTPIGSQLDGLLPAAPVAPRPPEVDVKTARELAARIAPATMNDFLSAVRSQTHSQLEALAFVLQEEYPNRISEQIKKEFGQRLVALRTEVQSPSGTESRLKDLENRLGWVRSLLTRPTIPEPTPVAVPTAPAQQPPSMLTGMFTSLSTRLVSMFTGRPATQAQTPVAQAQAIAVTSMVTQAGERIVDSIIAAPEMLSRIPGGSMLSAPITFLAGLMGSTPESRRDRMMRREAERAFQAALRANAVTCAAPTIDDMTWQSLKATVQPAQPGQPSQPVNMVAMVQAWVKVQRENGVAGQLSLSSAAELLTIDVLRKQLSDKRIVEQRTGLQTAIGTRIGRTVTGLTSSTEVQMQGSAGAVSISARLSSETPTNAGVQAPGAIPAPVPQATSDFDALGNPVSNEAKTLIGAARKFPRATKIRIVATGNIEMINPNEFVVPVGSFDETGTPQNNEARTLVGMSVRFANATKLKVAATGGNYELTNTTEYSAVVGGFADNGNTSTNEARKFEEAIRLLTGATKISVVSRGNSEVVNQNEFIINAATSIATLQRLAGMAPDEAVRRVVINGGLFPRDVPLLQRTSDEAVEINTHPNAAQRLAEVGWPAALNALGNNTRLNLATMQPIRPTTT